MLNQIAASLRGKGLTDEEIADSLNLPIDSILKARSMDCPNG
jgi:orotate phosphoribosyltransferase-like protein